MDPLFFFFNDTATTEIYTLSLHDALPISTSRPPPRSSTRTRRAATMRGSRAPARSCSTAAASTGTKLPGGSRSEEHTSELQSPCNLVCRLLLEKKKQADNSHRLSERPAFR